MTIEVLPDLFKRAADGVGAVAAGGPDHGGARTRLPPAPTEGSLVIQLSLLPRSAVRTSNTVATQCKTVGHVAVPAGCVLFFDDLCSARLS